MNDPPRKDVHRSIRRLMTGGVKVIMITGDAEATAVAIAKNIGIPVTGTPGYLSVLRGDELDKMSADELSEAIGKTTVFARTTPDHKMKIIKAKANEVVGAEYPQDIKESVHEPYRFRCASRSQEILRTLRRDPGAVWVQ